MLEKMARVNKVKLPENLFDDIDEKKKKVGYQTLQKKRGVVHRPGKNSWWFFAPKQATFI